MSLPLAHPFESLTPDIVLDDGEVLEWLGRFLARIHRVGTKRPFATRPTLSVDTFGIEPMQWLLEHDKVPLYVQSAWTKACQAAIDLITGYTTLAGASALKGSNSCGIRLLRLHGDCHPGNILWTPSNAAPDLGPGPHFVDLDDARMGPAVQALWMLLSGDRQQRTRQLGMLVDGYEQEREFNRDELALIDPCAPCASCTTAPGWRAAGATPPFHSTFRGSAAATTGRAGCRCSRSKWKPCRKTR